MKPILVGKTHGGLNIEVYGEENNSKVWAEMVKPIDNDTFYTPNDKLKYRLVSEVEVNYNQFKAVIEVNGTMYNIKYNLLNAETKTYALVRKIYAN